MKVVAIILFCTSFGFAYPGQNLTVAAPLVLTGDVITVNASSVTMLGPTGGALKTEIDNLKISTGSLKSKVDDLDVSTTVFKARSDAVDLSTAAIQSKMNNIAVDTGTMMGTMNTYGYTYLANSSATATYLQSSSATSTYLQLSSVTANYLQLSSATATYLNKATIIPSSQFPALTGDITTSAGSLATTIATTVPNAHTFSGPVTLSSTTISSTTLTGFLQLRSLPKATIKSFTPGNSFQVYGCSDCTTVPVCISTGPTLGAFSLITAKTSACN